MKPKLILGLALVLGGGWFGCSTHHSSPSQKPAYPLSAFQTPTNLVNQIAHADRIVVTNSVDSQYAGFSLTLSGNKAEELVRAMSFARYYTLQEDPGWLCVWELQFYKGSNRLASVPFLGGGFICDGGKQQWPMRQIYTDETGVLAKIYADVTRPKLTLAHNIQIPKEWSAGSENSGMPDCGVAERYVSAYDRGWWIAVQRYAEDINFDDPSALAMNGWAEEAYGGQVGYGSARDRIEELIRVYGKQRVSEYLQQFRLPDENQLNNGHADDVPATVWDSGSKEVDALVLQLVSTHPAPYPNGYDASVLMPYMTPQVESAMAKLKLMGPHIFPNLIKHIRDDRYSFSSISANWDNYTVGEAVINILADGHETAVLYKVRKTPSGFVGYLSFKDYLAARGAESWAEWAKNKTRFEIQIDFIDWCIAKEQERGFIDEAQKTWLLNGYQDARKRMENNYPDDLNALAAYKSVAAIETMPHDACATNMLQLTLWLKLAIGEGYRFPVSLASLAVCTNYPNFSNSLLVCPTTGHVPGAISNAEAWTDYIYVGNGDEGGMCDMALLISPPENHGGEYGYVVWGCGNIGKWPAAIIRRLIKEPWCFPAEFRGQPKVRDYDGFDKFVKPTIKIRIPARFASIYGTNSAAASRP